MIFSTLNASNERGELLLIDGGFCHWHLRRDGQLTIREIIVSRDRQGQGIGREMLAHLTRANPAATSIFAKCPADLPANGWYAAMGFICEGVETTKTGNSLNLWRLTLSTAQPETGNTQK